MDKIVIDADKLEEIEIKSRSGEAVKELLDKVNEIIDWINTQ